MGRELLDLYSDYLLCSKGQTTATGLSTIVDGNISHDKITRFLKSEYFDEKTLWKKVKPIVREYEDEQAILIFDDMIVEKPYMDENDIICWHFDHTENKSIKGINVLSAFYHCEKDEQIVRLPTGFRIIAKTEEYIDKRSGEKKRKSPATKNQMVQEMIQQHIQNRVKFRYILADSWYSSAENMRFISKRGKVFIFELKYNRQVTDSETRRNQGAFERLDQLKIPEGKPLKVWIKDLEFPVKIFKQVFTNKDGSTGQRFLVTNELTLTAGQFITLYKKRWGVEEYHKSLKQNASIGSSPAHTERTQGNHIFSAIFAYVKLEMQKLKIGLNHFAIKSIIYPAAMRTAMISFRKWKTTQNIIVA